MTVSRIAISLDADLARTLRKAVKNGEPLSAWLADAARRKLRAQGLAIVIDDWEAEHGEITEAELGSAARARAGRTTLTRPKRKRSAKPRRRRARSKAR